MKPLWIQRFVRAAVWGGLIVFLGHAAAGLLRFLASVSVIPYTASIVGQASHLVRFASYGMAMVVALRVFFPPDDQSGPPTFPPR